MDYHIENTLTNLYKAVLYYSASLKNDATQYTLVDISRVDEFNIVSKINSATNFKFKDNDISIRLIKSQNPLIDRGDGNTGYYSELIIHSPEHCIQEFLKASLDYLDEYILKKQKQEGHINIYEWDGFWEHIKKIKKRTVDTIFLPNDIVNTVIQEIEHMKSKEEIEYSKCKGINLKKIYLCEGPPGTGKSSLAKVIASHFNWSIYFLFLTMK